MPFGFNPFDDSDDDDDDDDSDTIDSLTFSNLEVTYDPESVNHTFSREADDFGGTYTSEGGRQLSTREIRNGGRPYTEHMPRSINTGLPLNLMDAPSLGYWFTEKALEQFTHDEIGEAFADGGPAGIARIVLEAASESITNSIDLGLNATHAFNEETNGWPRKAVLLLIQYEHDNVDRSDFDSYWSHVEEITEESEMPEISDGSNLDLFFSDNPCDDDDLVAPQRSTLLLLRSNNEDDPPDDLLWGIDDHTAFREWYKQVENVETAAEFCEFDTSANASVFRHAAPPDEWRPGTNPSSIRTESCQVCGIILRQITHESGDIVWVDQDGELIGADLVGEDGWTHLGARDVGIVCHDCTSQFDERANVVSFIYPSDDTHVCLDRDGSLTRDRAAVDERLTPVDSIGPAMRDDMNHAIRGSLSGFYSISPNSEFGDAEAQREAIESLAGQPGRFTSGPIIITSNNSGARVYVPNESATAVQEVKEEIESEVAA